MKRRIVLALIAAFTISLAACSQTGNVSSDTGSASSVSSAEVTEESVSFESGSAVSDLFTERDLDQSPDLSDATYITVESGKDVTIDSEGIYVLSGDAADCTVIIDANDDDKVQLVLDGLSITNSDEPAIYVKNADKVFVTAWSGESSLKVTGSFTADEGSGSDAVIFSKDDLVINGTGILNIISSDNGIACKDELKVTGSTLNIDCEGSAIEAKEAIEIADGTINITSCNDGLHAEDDDDDTVGSVFVGGGNITISAQDDGIHATTTITIDDGNIDITAVEGIEATVVTINGGNITIDASDDGINAAQKSSSLSPLFELNGGYVKITMGQGDTDGVDSNGDIIINGGTIDITGQSTFDYEKNAEYNGGTIIENGEETNTITNQFFGGPGGFNPRNMPEGFDPDNMPDDFIPGEMPEGFNPGNMPEDFDPSNLPEGFEPGQGGPGKPDGTGRPDGNGQNPPEKPGSNNNTDK